MSAGLKIDLQGTAWIPSPDIIPERSILLKEEFSGFAVHLVQK